jgi:hypothetical protein
VLPQRTSGVVRGRSQLTFGPSATSRANWAGLGDNDPSIVETRYGPSASERSRRRSTATPGHRPSPSCFCSDPIWNWPQRSIRSSQGRIAGGRAEDRQQQRRPHAGPGRRCPFFFLRSAWEIGAIGSALIQRSDLVATMEMGRPTRSRRCSGMASRSHDAGDWRRPGADGLRDQARLEERSKVLFFFFNLNRSDLEPARPPRLVEDRS